MPRGGYRPGSGRKRRGEPPRVVVRLDAEDARYLLRVLEYRASTGSDSEREQARRVALAVVARVPSVAEPV